METDLCKHEKRLFNSQLRRFLRLCCFAGCEEKIFTLWLFNSFSLRNPFFYSFFLLYSPWHNPATKETVQLIRDRVLRSLIIAHCILNPVHVLIRPGVHPGKSFCTTRQLTLLILAQADDASGDVSIGSVVKVHQWSTAVSGTRIVILLSTRTQLASAQHQTRWAECVLTRHLVDNGHFGEELYRAEDVAKTILDWKDEFLITRNLFLWITRRLHRSVVPHPARVILLPITTSAVNFSVGMQIGAT